MVLMTSCSCLPWCLLHAILMTLVVMALSYNEAEENDWMTSREPFESLDTSTLIQSVPKRIKESGDNDCRPKWKGNPEDIATHLTVISNDTFRLKCPAVEGKPKPSIRWLKNGKEFTKRWKGNITRRGSSALELKEAQSPFDEGNYTCIAENRCGTIQQDFSVRVIVRYFGKPVFDGPLENQTVTVGSNVTLVCRTLSDAAHIVYWLKIFKKNNTHESFDQLKTGERQFLNGTHLIIHFVEHNDSGRYACVAVNEFGSNSRSAWISVSEPEESRSSRTESSSGIIILADIAVTVPLRLPLPDERAGNYVSFYYVVAVLLGVVMLIVVPLTILVIKSRRKKTVHRSPLQPIVKQWEISRQNLKLFEPVGEGEFGIVYRGQITGSPDICGYLNQTVVAVKMLKVGATEKEMNDIFTEMETMKHLGHHPNVIQFIGCCTIDEPLAVVMEYAAYGSLKNVLRMCKSYMVNETVISEKEADFLLSDIALNSCSALITIPRLWRFALQVAKGMEYLAARKIVHRDVAARNVLVAENFVAKIADFGLTRDVTSSTSEQYIPGKHRCLPLKWMSPESLVEKVFTTKSDVWSFGVLLWEIFTYGSNPYPTVPIQNLFSLLKAGYRMGKPIDASDEMYLIMQNCWHFNAKDRPCFSSLVRQLESTAMTMDMKIPEKMNISEDIWKTEFIHHCQ